MHSATGKRATRSCWHLSGTQAELTADNLSGVIDLAQPHLGWQRLNVAGQQLLGSLSAITVGSGANDASQWQPHELYARGDDLVAAYRKPQNEPFNLQVYWRVHPVDGALATLDFIAAIHTPLWEAYPSVAVTSSIGEEVLHESPDVRLSRAGQLFCLEMTRPGDFLPFNDRTGWRYGDVFMERGVIRKLQLRTTWFATRPDELTISSMQQAFVAEPPPLTT